MTPDARRRRRRAVALVLYCGLLLFFVVAASEILVRVRGFRPHTAADLRTQVEPGGRFFQPHPALGYTHLPGSFTVTLHDGYRFRVTHGTNTLRATHPPRAEDAARPAVWVFGCSFTHGWSLNDEDTFPWRLQSVMPASEVVNFGVNGYGTAQSLVQFREFLKTERAPATVVLAYAYFHDERSTFRRSWRKAIVPYNRLGTLAPPYARLGADGAPVFHQHPAEYTEWPLQRVSALVHMIEQKFNNAEDRSIRSHEVTKALVRQFHAECRARNIRFVLAGITRGNLTADVLETARAEGIPAVDIAVNLSEPGSRNLPHDDHPSARSQAAYAATLAAFLSTNAPAR